MGFKLKSIDRFHHDDFISIVYSELPLEKLKNSTILISGATGLMGSNLIRTFVYLNEYKSTNIKLIGLVRNMNKVKKDFQDVYNREDVVFIKTDITKEIRVEQSIDYIFHTASVTQSKMFVSKPVDTLAITINGTTNMLNLAKNKNVKSFVYLSSMEVYGITDPKKEFIEEKDLGYINISNVRSSYSEGKRIAELLCISYEEQYNLNVKIARLAQTFGAGISLDENRVFAQFAKSLINKENIILHTKGESYGNYCYITDVIRALIIILIKGESSEAYNVSNESSNMMIKDMAKLVADDIGEGLIKLEFDIPKSDLKYGYAPDTKMKLSSKKLKNLNWYPEIGLKETYLRMIGSLKERL